MGGGTGIAVLHPITRALKEAGNHVIAIIGARSKDLLILEDHMRAASNELHVCTDDGSYGHHGFVTEVLKEVLEKEKINLAVVRVANPLGLAGAAYVGVVEMGVAFVMWLSALRLSENTAKVGNLIFISPFVSLFLIRAFVGEEILTATIAGLVLIVAGTALQRVGRRGRAGS